MVKITCNAACTWRGSGEMAEWLAAGKTHCPTWHVPGSLCSACLLQVPSCQVHSMVFGTALRPKESKTAENSRDNTEQTRWPSSAGYRYLLPRNRQHSQLAYMLLWSMNLS